MELWELEARESIRDLVARYNANGDAGRFDPLLALFAEDAVLELPEQRVAGRAVIRAFFEAVARGEGGRRPVRLLRHHTATLQIDVDSPDEARGRCYFQVFTETGLDHWGRYVDDYTRVEARWLFSRRRVTLDGAVPGSWAESPA
jgi:hypothetical protein